MTENKALIAHIDNQSDMIIISIYKDGAKLYPPVKAFKDLMFAAGLLIISSAGKLALKTELNNYIHGKQ